MISESPTDVQPVFDAIAERARVLCNAIVSGVARFDGEWVHLVAYHGVSREADEAMRSAFPMQVSRRTITARAIRERAPVQIVDVLADPDYGAKEAARLAGYRSNMAVPMLREGQVIGSIAVCRAETGPFPDKQVKLLQTFADQAVIAIENVRLFNETREALEQQTATAEVLRVISESPTDVQPVLDAVAQRALKLCDAAQSVIALVEGGDIRFVAGHGSTATAVGEVIPLDRGLVIGRAIVDRAVVHIDDLAAESEAEFPQGLNMQRRIGHRTTLAVPLLREGEAVGAIAVWRMEVRPFAAKQRKLLQTFADQAVIAIQNVRLFNETRQALERQTATAEVLQVISQSPTDVQPVLDAIAERAARLTGADYGVVSRFDDQLVHIVSSFGLDRAGLDALLSAFPMPADGRSITARAVRTRDVVNVSDMLADADLSPQVKQVVQTAGYRSGLAVPMLRDQQVVGAITVNRATTGAFAAKEVELLRTFASQAVIAIENVRLFNETREALERQTATAEILKVISESPTDVQPVFEAIAQRARRLCGALMSGVALYDGKLVHLAAYDGASDVIQARMLSAFPLPAGRETMITRAVAEGRPVQMADSQADPDYIFKDASREAGIRSHLAVPMMREGRVVGAMSVARPEPGLFPDRLVKLLQTFADQAVIAIENVRLFNETREALERQTATSQVLRVISDSPTDVQPVLDAVAERAGILCRAQGSRVWLLEGDHLRAMTSYGHAYGPESERELLPLGRGSLGGRAFLDGRYVHVEDIAPLIETEYPDVREMQARYGFRSVLAVPMLREGRSIGVISLLRNEVRAFSETEISLVQTFADQAVIAIENVRLFSETKEALERQTATAEVLQVISSSVADTAPVFEKILDSCQHLFATEQLGIFQVRDDGQVEVAAWRGTALEAVVRTFPKPLEQSASAQVLRDRRTLHIPDVAAATDAPPTVRKVYEQIGNYSVAWAPMLWEDRGVGTIAVLRQPPRPFSDRELALLKTFADQAVIAIQNARLFNETKESLERQTATAEILRVISGSVTDTQPVFDAIVQSCQRLFSGKAVTLIFPRGDMLESVAFSSDQGDQRGADVLKPWPLDRDSATGACILDSRVINVGDTTEGAKRYLPHARPRGEARLQVRAPRAAAAGT